MSYVSDVDAKGATVILRRVGTCTLLTALAIGALVAVIFAAGGSGRYRPRMPQNVK